VGPDNQYELRNESETEDIVSPTAHQQPSHINVVFRLRIFEFNLSDDVAGLHGRKAKKNASNCADGHTKRGKGRRNTKCAQSNSRYDKDDRKPFPAELMEPVFCINLPSAASIRPRKDSVVSVQQDIVILRLISKINRYTSVLCHAARSLGNLMRVRPRDVMELKGLHRSRSDVECDEARRRILIRYGHHSRGAVTLSYLCLIPNSESNYIPRLRKLRKPCQATNQSAILVKASWQMCSLWRDRSLVFHLPA
jgi:hypothetical protein